MHNFLKTNWEVQNFPEMTSPSGWACPTSNLKPLCIVVDSHFRLPYALLTAGLSSHGISFTNDSMTLRLHQFDILQLLLPSTDSENLNQFEFNDDFFRPASFFDHLKPSFKSCKGSIFHTIRSTTLWDEDQWVPRWRKFLVSSGRCFNGTVSLQWRKN